MEWLNTLDAKKRATAEKVRAAAKKWGVPENLALAAAMQESSLDQRKKSGTGPVGVMMMGRRASKEMGINPHNEDQNIEGGVRLLGQYLEKYGSPQTALIAYHDGPNSSYFKGGQPSDAAINHLKKVQSYGGFQGDIPTMAKDDQLPFKITEVSPIEDITFPESAQDVEFFGRPRDVYDYGAGTAGAALGYRYGANAPLSTRKQELELRKQGTALKQLEAAQKSAPVVPKTFGQDIGNWVPGQYSQDIALNINQPSSMEAAAEQARVLETKKRLAEAKFGPTQPARPGSPIVIPGNMPQFPGTSFPPEPPSPKLSDMPAAKVGAGRSGWGRAGNVTTGALGASQLMDAYQRAEQGDPVGATFSGVGGAGLSAGTHITNPKARAVALGFGALSSLLGQGYDYLRDKFNITPKEQPEEKAAGGLMSLPKYAGRAKSLVSIGASAKNALKDFSAQTPAWAHGDQTPGKMSDWAQNYLGGWLTPTQADRMGGVGGPSYSAHQLARPEYAGRAWGSGEQGTATAITNLAKDPRFGGVQGQVFAPLLGERNMHQSNLVAFDALKNAFYKQKLPQDLRTTINEFMQRGGPTSGGNLRFDPYPGFDIADRDMINELAQTFKNRKAIAAHAFGGEGLGGRKAQIIPHQQMLDVMTDPFTQGVPTFSVGPRAFQLSGDVEKGLRPDLNAAYPYQLMGKDLGVTYAPVPSELALPDFQRQWRKDVGKELPLKSGALPKPGYFEHTLGYKLNKDDLERIYPRQQITEDWIKELQRSGYAHGGLVHLQGGGNPKVAALRSFIDPATKYLKDWNWKPMSEVGQRLDMREVPDYIQGGYGQFMRDQAARASKGELGPRDLLKAYGITQSSIGRGGLPHATATKAGLRLPNTGGEVRPEGAFAEWLGSPMGQRFLDTATQGNPDPRALAQIQAQFAPFGKQNQLVDQLKYASQVMPGLSKDLNQAITGDKDAYRQWAEQMKGVAGAKSGFIGSMLGRGDLPTFDARQIALHTGNQAPVGIGSIMNRGKGAGGRESVDRLAARQEALGVDIDPSLAPYYQHLTHHAVWDKLGDNKTTHEDIIRAMRDYAQGGLVHLGGGGVPGKAGIPNAVVKAYKLFRTKKNAPNELYPLFVNKNTPVPVGQWVDATEGPLTASGGVQSSLGALAYRPGWHAGDMPVATHIGGYTPEQKAEKARIMALRKQAAEERGITDKKGLKEINKEFPMPEGLTSPSIRPADQVWAEVEMPADVDWQKIATQRGTSPEGKFTPGLAHITDQLPMGGHYRYKTNPNMTGDWLIGGSMKVNRVLSDEEVEAINQAMGVSDLPRMK